MDLGGVKLTQPARRTLAKPPRSALRALCAGVALACLTACAGDPEQSLSLSVIAGCEAESYAACAVIDTACQEQIFKTVACLRQMPDATRPEVRVITRAEYEAELSAPAEGAEEPAPTTEQEPEMESASVNLGDARVSRALELLGLAQPMDFTTESVVALYSETVPGYYSNDGDLITVVDRGADEPRTDGADTLLMAHEYAHALQDQDVDLSSLWDQNRTFDQYLALLAVVEGEASMLESFYAAGMWRLEGDIDFDSHFTAWVPDAEESFGAQSPLLVSPRYFPYSFGARYVYGIYSEGGMAAVRATFTDLPTSVIGMLDGAAEGASAEPLAALPPPAALSGFELVGHDTLGPWIFGKFLLRSLSQYAFDQLASRWRGDRFFVYGRSDALNVTGIWAVQLETEAAADQFALMVRGGNANLSPSAVSVRTGRNVAVVVTDDAMMSAPWTANITAAQEAAPEPGSTSAGAPRIAPLVRRRMTRFLSPLR